MLKNYSNKLSRLEGMLLNRRELMKIILAGPGAFGKKHLDGLKHIEGVEVVALVGQPLEPTQAVAA